MDYRAIATTFGYWITKRGRAPKTKLECIDAITEAMITNCDGSNADTGMIELLADASAWNVMLNDRDKPEKVSEEKPKTISEILWPNSDKAKIIECAKAALAESDRLAADFVWADKFFRKNRALQTVGDVVGRTKTTPINFDVKSQKLLDEVDALLAEIDNRLRLLKK